MRPFGRHRAVAFRVSAVAEAAILLEQRLPGLDRRRSRGNRVLHLLGFRAAARVLRPGTQGDQRGADKGEHRNESSRYASHNGRVSWVVEAADSMPHLDRVDRGFRAPTAAAGY